MALSRRAFLGGGSGASPVLVALVAARGLEAATAAWEGGALPVIPPRSTDEVKINANESPVGPGKRALDALLAELDQSKRYPFNKCAWLLPRPDARRFSMEFCTRAAASTRVSPVHTRSWRKLEPATRRRVPILVRQQGVLARRQLSAGR